ncbi:MAG: hypothetical protein IKO49_06670 [Bacilli bacterium]|nr:hypothetical protein [Bacilli bacterium]
MKKYNLCLYYSSKVYRPIIDKDFFDFKEIDEYTMNYFDESDFRNEHLGDIVCIQNLYRDYIRAIKNPLHRNGKIVIVTEDENGVSYIKPLYKSNHALSSPKKLFNTIIEKLKRENNNEVLVDFINKFRGDFYTEYNQYRGINKMKNALYYHEHINPTSGTEKPPYERLLSIIKETLFLSYDKTNDTTSDIKYFKSRMMNDYLDNRCFTSIEINSKIIEKCSKTKLKKKDSKKISETQEVNKNSIQSSIEKAHSEFIERVITDAYKSGREPSLLDFARDEYWAYIEFFEEYEEYCKKKGNSK